MSGLGYMNHIAPQILALALLIPLCLNILYHTVQYHNQSVTTLEEKYEESQGKVSERLEELKERLKNGVLEIESNVHSTTLDLEYTNSKNSPEPHEEHYWDGDDLSLHERFSPSPWLHVFLEMDLGGIIKLLIFCSFCTICWMAWINGWFLVSMRGLDVTREVEMHRTTEDGTTTRQVAIYQTLGQVGQQIIKTVGDVAMKFMAPVEMLENLLLRWQRNTE